MKFVSGIFLSVPGTSSLMGMLAKWSGSANSDCNKWIEQRLRSPRFIELRKNKFRISENVLLFIGRKTHLEAIFISRSGSTVSRAVTK